MTRRSAPCAAARASRTSPAVASGSPTRSGRTATWPARASPPRRRGPPRPLADGADDQPLGAAQERQRVVRRTAASRELFEPTSTTRPRSRAAPGASASTGTPAAATSRSAMRDHFVHDRHHQIGGVRGLGEERTGRPPPRAKLAVGPAPQIGRGESGALFLGPGQPRALPRRPRAGLASAIPTGCDHRIEGRQRNVEADDRRVEARGECRAVPRRASTDLALSRSTRIVFEQGPCRIPGIVRGRCRMGPGAARPGPGAPGLAGAAARRPQSSVRASRSRSLPGARARSRIAPRCSRSVRPRPARLVGCEGEVAGGDVVALDIGRTNASTVAPADRRHPSRNEPTFSAAVVRPRMSVRACARDIVSNATSRISRPTSGSSRRAPQHVGAGTGQRPYPRRSPRRRTGARAER